jgi:imidazolonepropionase-like amidohydrolase
LITPAPVERIAIFNTEKDSIMFPLVSAEAGRRYVRTNNRRGSTGIKIWGMMPDDSAFVKNMLAVKEETVKSGNSLIVHATTLNQAKMALALGTRLLVHSVHDTLIDDEFLSMLKVRNTLYNPTLQVSRNYLVSMRAVLGDKPFQLNDPHRAMDKETYRLLENASLYKGMTDTTLLKERIAQREPVLAKNYEFMQANLKRVYEAGGAIVVGTDAGNPGTFHGLSYYQELEEMQAAGIAPGDLIVMATRNGALAMERLNDFGTLEGGKLADLIILEKDPSADISNVRSITHVMRGGLLRPVNEPLK